MVGHSMVHGMIALTFELVATGRQCEKLIVYSLEEKPYLRL